MIALICLIAAFFVFLAGSFDLIKRINPLLLGLALVTLAAIFGGHTAL